jgi:hypothetical protein
MQTQTTQAPTAGLCIEEHHNVAVAAGTYTSYDVQVDTGIR